jgi:succinoglycan biosynthesis transport protein ExoP
MSSLVAYTPAVSQLNCKTADEIAGRDLSKYKLVIYVSPCLAQSSVPSAMLRLADLNLVVIGANETWLSADKESLLKIEAMAAAAPLFTWLVNTEETNLEGIIGEIPKKRSWLRRKVKKLITLNLR